MKSLLVSSAIAAALTAMAQPVARTPPEYLSRNHFTQEDLGRIERGEPVAKLVETSEPTETRILGVVKIRGNPEDYIARQRDVVSFERGAGVLQIGRFSNPATASDLADLTLDADDLEDLKKCEQGDCDIKLSDARIDAFRKIDWRAPDAVRNAEQLTRQMIADFMNAYRTGGNAALSAFHDKQKPLRVKEEFEEMISLNDLPAYFPSLHAFLKDYPKAAIPESEEIFYWSKVDFGLKPVVRLNHLVIYRPATVETVRYAIASKMLYTSHYFNTGLELKFLVVTNDAPGSYYLVSLNQSRSDGLTGFTGAILGGQIRGKAREGSEKYLAAVKKIMESAGP